ncbi:hypothetical protein EDC04DRAFT_2610000 [Pisolithus marmoratus]|nr:hypothetical protein EDC04DRAFT_2610000 [Pisolithus marmoratus]
MLWALVCTPEPSICLVSLIPTSFTDTYIPPKLGRVSGCPRNCCEEKKVMVYLSHLSFVNTNCQWINLLTSSSGPVKISVSACATTLQSVEIACDIIISNKAKMMIVGGFNDISEEGSSKFANLKATSNVETEFVMGCEHTEMLRPTTTTHTEFSSRSLIFLGCGSARSALLNGVSLIMLDVAVVEKIGILRMLAV